MVSDETTIPREYLERLEARPAISRQEYEGLKRRIDALRHERDFALAERDRQATVLTRRIERLERALGLCRDCHSVKQVRTIVRTALARAAADAVDGRPAGVSAEGGQP